MIHKHMTRLAVTALLSSLCMTAFVSAPALAAPLQAAPVASGNVDWNKLGLSPEQAKQINLKRMEFEKIAIPLKADIRLKQIDIQRQLMAPAYNPLVVQRLMDEKLALENRLQKEALNNFLAMKKLLTPTQLVKLPSVMGVIR